MQSNIETLKETFKKMKLDGFDINLPLEWGFYFIDKSKTKLLSVYKELEDSGYSLKSINEIGDGELMLHVTKVDILTPDKLHRRNNAFNDLADYCNVDLYDGWDVERI